ncbi:MAG: hypothetical protein NT165_01020 [Candidatus Falkowbacteria bacterium]|nr:hypothetical protein [Candidatus Falkowbacteria bacterium]
MSTFTIGAMNQLGDALENAGFSAEEVTKLKQFNNLKGIRDILNGRAEIKYPEHLIDCDSAPFVPEGFTLVSHKKGGMWKWNPSVPFYLSKKQKKGGYSVGTDLQKELEGQPVLNANVLDYLLAHPELIPESWKGKAIFFWGTIYRDSSGSLCVRYLRWSGSEWGWIYYYLGLDFYGNDPAALAS